MTEKEKLEYWQQQNSEECEEVSLLDMCSWGEYN